MAKKRPQSAPTRNGKAAVSGQIRIIGGQWRGRKLPVADLPGLRPTTDRVKETLFNWLQFELRDARVLDVFAGTGSLGFEALSRGARELVMIEKANQAARQLQQNVATLAAADRATVICADALATLHGTIGTFNLVLLDPPFNQALLQPCIDQLAAGNLVANQGWVYIECEQQLTFTTPANWRLHREKTAGQVAYRLYQVTAA
ncbi:16S rRNA (guanine(966)-N(2))-methyltransferase RsmD [Aliidiomarina sp.]|uniref:16S rRNA (guanine(966)-N(2))-methyltransferase RsmD n=1 Tax=Aliidiomarina sp. TaxID=1872439 RepID=UPI003A4D2151